MTDFAPFPSEHWVGIDFPGSIPPSVKVASLFLRKVTAVSWSDLWLTIHQIYKISILFTYFLIFFSFFRFLDHFLAFFFHNRLLYTFLQHWPCWFIGLIFFSLYWSLCFPGHPLWSFLLRVAFFLHGIQISWTPWTIPLSISPMYPTFSLPFAV